MDLVLLFRASFKLIICGLPLNDPAIAPIQRTIANSDIEEIVVCKISLKSNNVGPNIAPHNPFKFYKVMV